MLGANATDVWRNRNFGICKFGKTGTAVPHEPPQTPNLDPSSSAAKRQTRNDASTALEQLRQKGLIPIMWHGKCEGDKVTMGTYDVPANQGGMYALVFDNTFSKQVSKTA